MTIWMLIIAYIIFVGTGIAIENSLELILIVMDQRISNAMQTKTFPREAL